MVNVNVFVEGKTDKEFLETLIDFHFNEDSSRVIFDLVGNHSRLPQKSDRLKEGKLNLIILDSDVNNTKLVHESLKPLVEEENAAGRELRYECFFVERNLEDLVRKITPDNKAGLWKCIDDYAHCNSGLSKDGLKAVDNKAKVYIYVNAHQVPENLKLKAFKNPDIWNLNHEALNPLLDFLKPHFS